MSANTLIAKLAWGLSGEFKNGYHILSLGRG